MNTPSSPNDPLPHDPDDACSEHGLCADDGEALEALCAAEFECDKVSEHMRARARRMAATLGLLNISATSTPEEDRVLIDVTCAQIARTRRRTDLDLSPRDEDALEALICSGLDPSRCPSGVRVRAAHQARVLAMLDMPVIDTDRIALVSATLAHVQSKVDGQDSRMQLAERPARIGFKPRWSDLVSVAALMLIGTAVLAPMLGAIRSHGQRTACNGNMSAAGLAFGQYAADNRDSLPMATNSPAGTRWWNVGQPAQSNSANLFTILKTGYARTEALACSGNPTACRESSAAGSADWRSLDQVSYSYQNLFARERPKWTGQLRLVVLADRSPVVPRAVRGEWINPVENSLNHAGSGQTVLFNDCTTQWLRTPVLKSGDNIWLPRVLEDAIARLQNPSLARPLQGTETPVGMDDVFLGP